MAKKRFRSLVIEPTEEGVWLPLQRHKQILACCDCGLVHSVDFKVSKRGGELKMRAFRMNRVTAVNRRRRLLAVTHQQRTAK